MIPGYPPELGGRNCTPVQTLVYLEEMASRGIPRSLHFPGYAIVAPSLLEFGNDEQKRARAGRDPRRHDLVHRHERAERRLRPRRACRPAPTVHDDHFVVNGQKVWTCYATIAQMCCCYVRTDPDRAEAQGHQPADRRHGHAGHRDPTAPPHQRLGRLRRGVLHRRRRRPREPRRRAQRRLAHHAGLARARARRALGRGRRPARADHRRARRARQAARRAPTTRSCAAASPRATSAPASLRALGYKGFTSFAQGSSAPEHSYMKMATSELGKELYELGMEIQGPYGPVDDDRSGARRPAAGRTRSS